MNSMQNDCLTFLRSELLLLTLLWCCRAEGLMFVSLREKGFHNFLTAFRIFIGIDCKVQDKDLLSLRQNNNPDFT